MSAETLRGRYGAVSAGSALAATSAMRVLQDGGNAVDAAIAGAAVQCVVEMPWCGIGGDGFALVRTPDGAVHGLNGSGVAPLGVLDALDGAAKVPRFGAVSAAVPGVVDAWAALHQRFGTVPWDSLFEPARRYAAEGVPLDRRLLHALGEIPTIDGGDGLEGLIADTQVALGALFRQPDLARTLEAIAAGGRDAFYTGPIAERIAEHVQRRGGALGVDDLRSHRGTWRAPSTVRFRDAVVHTNAPVSMGILLLVCLRAVERCYPGGAPADLLERTDVLVRLKHIVFGEVLPMLGDPDHRTNPDVLDDALVDDIATRLGAGASSSHGMALPLGGDTTSLAVSAPDGTSVCLIHSLFNEFGARELVPGTGIVLNDRLANLRPGTGNNALVPGRRPLHTLHCYLAQRSDGSFVTGSTPGGRGQVQVNLQVLLDLVDGGDELQAAVTRPRWVNGLPRRSPEDRTVYLESGLAYLEDGLSARGHDVEVVDAEMNDHFGNCSIVGCDAGGDLHVAAADHRRDGHAVVW